MRKRFNNFYQKVGLWPLVTSAVSFLIIVFAALSYPNQPPLKGWFTWISTFFSRAIQAFAEFFNQSFGTSIVVLTILIRFLILPLMIYQADSMKKMQKIQPKIMDIQVKYRGKRDTQSLQNQQAEQQALYKEEGVNPFASFIPLIVQMPILLALFDSFNQTHAIKDSTFLNFFQLGQPDKSFILPILAAVFTFISSWLAMQANQTSTGGVAKFMPYIFPVMIFFIAMQTFSGLSLYWVISNAFQAAQTFFLQNPFKARAEREAAELAEKERKKAIRKALSDARKVRNRR